MAEPDPSAPTLFELGALTSPPTATPFMDLENPRYAYMFGFLQADGHLARGAGAKGALSVELNARDIKILEEFQRLTPYNSTISRRTRSTNFAAVSHTAIWSLCALEARTKLSDLGLPYGRKSRRITPPRVSFSRPDYLRGLIDADGSVGFTRDGLPFVSLTTSSTAIALYLCHYTNRVLGIRKIPGRNKRDGAYNVVYLREGAVALAQHLYTPDALALKRKQRAAVDVSAWERAAGAPPARRVRTWTPLEDSILLSAASIEEAAIALDRTHQSCNLRRWRLTKKN
ncbi:LAGLIDADG family homing endonuclease [Streptomyces sp. NPDC101158]|uniref:LAGLIDADG family homing endonuclease n=1 Tax=Streptomyces sp. NPDC101158 TaxID=3366117 RepID=UPI00380F981E